MNAKGATTESRAKAAAYMRAYNAKNPEGNRVKCRAYYHKNRAIRLVKTKEYAAANKEKIGAYQRAYARSEQGKAARTAAENKRRAQKQNCDTPASHKEVRELLRSAKECCYCHQTFGPELDKSLDHVVPLSKGGAHSLENLVVSCLPCNLHKGTQGVWEFYFT